MAHANNAKEQVDAYILVFQNLFYRDAFLTNNIKYISIDLTNALLVNKSYLVEAISNFCNKQGYTLLQDTFDGLKAKGFIQERWSRFTDGVLIVFHDKQLSDNILITSSHIYRDGLSARGLDYTVTKNNSSWEIAKAENEWSS